MLAALAWGERVEFYLLGGPLALQCWCDFFRNRGASRESELSRSCFEGL